MPKVSVLMPVYNAEKYLKEAIESILNQTFQDFEFLIIDDCSTDRSRDIIREYSDKRIKLLCNSSNIGVAATLNKGIKAAKGELIARMDADDISAKERIEKQVKYMEENQECILCGGNIQYINEKGKRGRKIKFPQEYESIKFVLFFENAFAHPTVMFRKEQFIKNNYFYDQNQKAEDYGLWCKIKENMVNLDEIFVFYRIHQKKVTYTNEDNLDESVNEIQKYYWEMNGLHLDINEPIEKYAQNAPQLEKVEELISILLEKQKMNSEKLCFFLKILTQIYENYMWCSNKLIFLYRIEKLYGNIWRRCNIRMKHFYLYKQSLKISLIILIAKISNKKNSIWCNKK